MALPPSSCQQTQVPQSHPPILTLTSHWSVSQVSGGHFHSLPHIKGKPVPCPRPGTNLTPQPPPAFCPPELSAKLPSKVISGERKGPSSQSLWGQRRSKEEEREQCTTAPGAVSYHPALGALIRRRPFSNSFLKLSLCVCSL